MNYLDNGYENYYGRQILDNPLLIGKNYLDINSYNAIKIMTEQKDDKLQITVCGAKIDLYSGKYKWVNFEYDYKSKLDRDYHLVAKVAEMFNYRQYGSIEVFDNLKDLLSYLKRLGIINLKALDVTTITDLTI